MTNTDRGGRYGALALAVMLTLAGCAGDGEPEGAPDRAAPDSTLSVYTVNYPLQYLARQIGGERVNVVFPAPADVDPAFWRPDAEVIVAYQQADLILLNGAGYAKWIETASLPRARMVDTSAGIGDRLIPIEDTVTHGHGPAGEHSHEGYAFTTWLDPGIAVEQAKAILEAFVEARPRHESEFREGFASLEVALLALDLELEQWKREVGETPVIFSHPVYQYLVRRCELNAQSLHWEPDEMPDEGQWRELENLIQPGAGRWMVWEDRPLEATVERLRSLGIDSVVLETCANTPREGDYLSVMSQGIAQIKGIGAQLH